MSATYTVGIDLGGTNIKGGVSDEHGAVLVRHSVETQAEGGVEHVLARMAGLVAELLSQAKLEPGRIAGVGVGAPGPMSHARGVIYSAPNMPGFVNVPLRDRFAGQDHPMRARQASRIHVLHLTPPCRVRAWSGR